MSARIPFNRVLALVCMSMCCLNAFPLSYVTLRIVGNECSGVNVTGIDALKSVTCGLVFYPVLYGVITN